MGERRKIADIPWLNRWAEAILAGWIRLAYSTSTWEKIGFEEMENVLRGGEPAILVLWHQRVMMSPYLFDPSLGPICSLTSSSRAGRLAGNVTKRFGMDTINMSSHQRHVALTRAVLRRIREGTSVGIAADGPRGPARIASSVPATWARATRKRVFLVSYSARRVHVLPTWDRLWFPALWTRGVFMCREWHESISSFPEEAEAERLRLSLQNALNAVTDEADRAAGRVPEKTEIIQ